LPKFKKLREIKLKKLMTINLNKKKPTQPPIIKNKFVEGNVFIVITKNTKTFICKLVTHVMKKKLKLLTAFMLYRVINKLIIESTLEIKPRVFSN
jgi:hypothetical protein